MRRGGGDPLQFVALVQQNSENRQEYHSNWIERLRQIKQIRARLAAAPSGTDADFTEFAG